MNIADFIIIGRGMIGSATAYHIANKGLSVTLIGPSDPKDIKERQNIFASHYDSARIMRTLDPVLHNCELVKDSIASAKILEKKTGIKFFHETGFLAASDNKNYLNNISAHAKKYYPNFANFNNEQLVKRFPYFKFAKNVAGVFQRYDAGWINPRENIKAQNQALSSLDNSLIVDDIVLKVKKHAQYISVDTSKSSFKCKKCIFSTGAFANIGNIIPKKIKYGVYRRQRLKQK